MKHIYVQKLPALASAILIAAMLGACSTVPLPNQPTALGKETQLTLSPEGDAKQFRIAGELNIGSVTVEIPKWPAPDSAATQEEVKEVINRFQAQLMSAIKPAGVSGGQRISVRATITEGRTVSSGLNLLTTAILLIPVDRGGAVIELEAFDQTGKVVAAMMYRYSGEITEFKSNFSKTGQIHVATQRASERFAKLLFEK